MSVKSFHLMEPALYQEYWKEMIGKSTIKQHSRNHIKKTRRPQLKAMEKDTEKYSHHPPRR